MIIVTFLKFYVNVMNRNIKIQNIFYILKVSKSILPGEYIQQHIRYILNLINFEIY